MNGRFIVLFPVWLALAACASAPPQLDTQIPDRLSCGKRLQPEHHLQLDRVDELVARDLRFAALAYMESQPLETQEQWSRYGRLLASVGRLDHAEQVFNQLVTRCDSPEAFHGLALVQMRQYRLNAALENLAIARARLPASAEVRNDYGYVLMLDRRPEEALHELRTAFELAEGEGPVRQNLAMAFLMVGDDEGIRWMQANYGFTDQELVYARDQVK
ncbi:MAG: hypothetical protein LAT63_07340 [Marinobacter sp.]|nr:hypothetical protein [Marinobacter sp.]